MPVFAAPDLRSTSPHADFEVPIALESAHRNLKLAIEKCHQHTSINTGAIYPGLRRADLEFFQSAGYPPVLLAMYELTAGGPDRTRIRAWAPKPTFGQGYSFLAKAAEQLAIAGAGADCAKAGFD